MNWHRFPCSIPSVTASLLALVAPSLVAQAGSLDPSFGAGGVVTSTPRESSLGSAVQADGKIVVGGYRTDTASVPVLRRYLSDGSLDASFGSGGDASFGAYNGWGVMAVAVDAAGRILAAGQHNGTFAVLRFTAGGWPDATFGTGGLVTLSGPRGYRANSVLVQPDGRILAHGTAISGRFSTGGAIVVARFLDDGRLDTSFGTGSKKKGYTLIDFGKGTWEDVWRPLLARMADGRILAGGNTNSAPTGGNQTFVVRLLADGSVDASFGSGGIAYTGGSAFRMVAQPDGKLLVTQGASLLRLRLDGTLDPTFGAGGVATLGLATTHGLYALAVRSDGRILVDVSADVDATTAMAFPVQLLPSGALDPTFGTSGVGAPVTFPDRWTCLGMGGMAIDPLGRLVTAGVTNTTTADPDQPVILVTRYRD